jgi:hypothetical protein
MKRRRLPSLFYLPDLPLWYAWLPEKVQLRLSERLDKVGAFVSNRRRAVIMLDHTSIEQFREMDGLGAPWVVGGERTS